jgi:hypothetical protein
MLRGTKPLANKDTKKTILLELLRTIATGSIHETSCFRHATYAKFREILRNIEKVFRYFAVQNFVDHLNSYVVYLVNPQRKMLSVQ